MEMPKRNQEFEMRGRKFTAIRNYNVMNYTYKNMLDQARETVKLGLFMETITNIKDKCLYDAGKDIETPLYAL